MDYLVMEAVALKANHEDEEAAKAKKKEEWRKDTSHLKKYQ